MEATMMGWVGDIGWAGWTVMTVCTLVFWAVAIYLVATLFRTDRADGPARTEQDDPLRTLERCFARGDITSDEFVSRRRTLTQPGGAASTGEQQEQARG
ncbi:hypothetical protein Y013_25495 (plasmid) [Rhodococcus pyridinivorans SB3094]|uniref:SHOCT domain-containing protein n=1 Tax=Rhodococcus pyridinivorans SB3094 TaxID=1435356 RepID=V9XKV4_9NOCA|nr:MULTISPECIES: hypothetical protein [Rhodococcus]AHD24091.1 hypothetical protein Y013_25495 [Rhodococcus pyridinivorans SB3094]AYA23480.1 SHOCT domain-containing protein [Rhodococcus rhodochrous]MCR8695362.1 SHOCT domain-containing protein [Rhodococcus pyridinivorans]